MQSNMTSAVAALLEELGPKVVSTDTTALKATSYDAWPVAVKWAMQNKVPYPADAIVRATRPEQVVATLKIANRLRVPVTTRAMGSSVTGQPLPTRGGIVLDVTGLQDRVQIDEVNLTVTVMAGHPGGSLEEDLNAKGYTLGHSPQSLHRSSVGGWVATFATGQFSSRYGGIEDIVVGYRVALPTAEVITLQAKPRAAMGPDLRQLFIGSEGALGVILSVTLRIWPLAAHRRLGAYQLASVQAGLAVLRDQAAIGLRPLLLRLYDAEEATNIVDAFPQPSSLLLTGTEGAKAVADAEFDELERIVLAHGGRPLGLAPVERWFDNRYSFAAVEAVLARPGGYAETIEVAHTWSALPALYHDIQRALTPLADRVMAHFSHVYAQGSSMYMIVTGQAESDALAEARLMTIWQAAMRVCLDHGAALSHHHGAGLARSRYVAESAGTAHGLLKRLKAALDPEYTLNPGKLGL